MMCGRIGVVRASRVQGVSRIERIWLLVRATVLSYFSEVQTLYV